MKKLLVVSMLFISVGLFISSERLYAQISDQTIDSFRTQCINYMTDLQAVANAIGMSSDVDEQVSKNIKKIQDFTDEDLAFMGQVLPLDPEWWDIPGNILENFSSTTQGLTAADEYVGTSMRPIVPGVGPDCLDSVLEELIGASAAVRAAEIAVQFTPGDFVFGLIVLGEGEVSTKTIHPLRFAAVVALEIAKTAEEVLKDIQIQSDFCFGSHTSAIIHDFVEPTSVHLQVIQIKTLGCSQGFWKNHTELWDSAIAAGGDLSPTYDPGTLFDDVFGPDTDQQAGIKNGSTLLDALKSKGGDITSQARNAVTLLLNNDALDNGRMLPCEEPAGDVGPFQPIAGPFMRRFVLSSSEGGEPVDVDLIEVYASIFDPANLTFEDIKANTSTAIVKTGVLSVEIVLPSELKNVRVFQFKVKHDHGLKSIDDGAIFGRPTGVDIVHFGTILFHQDHTKNLGMGQ